MPNTTKITFAAESEAMFDEVGSYYDDAPFDVSSIVRELESMYEAHKNESIWRLKERVYGIIADRMDVHVFRHYPFYFAMRDGQPRTSWGCWGLGAFLCEKKYSFAPHAEEMREYQEANVITNWGPVSTDHHAAGYDNILRFGLLGLIERAEHRRSSAATEAECGFLDAAIAGNRALIRIAERFSEKARTQAATEGDAVVRARLIRIADTAKRIPAHPPATFYEALAAILFMREALGRLDGFGISTFGHLDRMLRPYYDRDIADGRLSRDEAKSLLAYLVAGIDAKWGYRRSGLKHTFLTSTTAVVGGCDAAGIPVFNDITCLMLENAVEYRIGVGVNLLARVSKSHPKEYLNRLGEAIAAGVNSITVYNDETIIGALVRSGKRTEDARLFVGGGCHEVVLQNSEMHSRAYAFFNLPYMVLATILPEKAFAPMRAMASYSSFDDLYRQCLENIRAVHADIAGRKAKHQRHWQEWNPMPAYSATLDDCIDRAQDATAGGVRYVTDSISMCSPGSFIDSLFAVRHLVYDAKRATLDELRAALRENFAGRDQLRAYLQWRVPKHGSDDSVMNDFAARVFADLAIATGGNANGLGGRFVPAFYTHSFFWRFGDVTGATPDGRRAGENFSRGIGGAETHAAEISRAVGSLAGVDLSAFPESAVLEVTLPVTRAANDPAVVAATIGAFLNAGGSSLQFNVLDADKLREAKKDPQKHQGIVVRVCGYSAYFNGLPETTQDEVIARALMR